MIDERRETPRAQTNRPTQAKRGLEWATRRAGLPYQRFIRLTLEQALGAGK